MLISCMMLTGMLQYGMRQTAEVENLMTSVERILEYGAIKSEAALEMKDGTREDWPSNGKIEFRDVFLSYGDNEEMVLKGLNFCTKSREKV